MRQESGAAGDIVILEDQRRCHCGTEHASLYQPDEPKGGTRGRLEPGNDDVDIEHNTHTGSISSVKMKSRTAIRPAAFRCARTPGQWVSKLFENVPILTQVKMSPFAEPYLCSGANHEIRENQGRNWVGSGCVGVTQR